MILSRRTKAKIDGIIVDLNRTAISLGQRSDAAFKQYEEISNENYHRVTEGKAADYDQEDILWKKYLEIDRLLESVDNAWFGLNKIFKPEYKA